MAGGVLFAIVFSRNDPGFAHNGGLLRIDCDSRGLGYRVSGAFLIGGIGSLIFIYGYKIETEKCKIDDVLGVWPLPCRILGRPAVGGAKALGGGTGVSFLAQCTGT